MRRDTETSVDIDNTLVPHGAPADERACALFAHLKELGFKCCFLSNNQYERVSSFNDAIGAQFIENAHKPSTKNYIRAMELLGTDRSNTVFIGDQLFTDIYGAKRTGIRNILVKPLNPKEEIQIVLKRYLERIVLYFYRKEEGIHEPYCYHRIYGFSKTRVGKRLAKDFNLPFVDVEPRSIKEDEPYNERNL